MPAVHILAHLTDYAITFRPTPVPPLLSVIVSTYRCTGGSGTVVGRKIIGTLMDDRAW